MLPLDLLRGRLLLSLLLNAQISIVALLVLADSTLEVLVLLVDLSCHSSCLWCLFWSLVRWPSHMSQWCVVVRCVLLGDN